MEVLEFATEVIGVSASGVLAPGPLFLTNLILGTRQGSKAGLKVACGHGVVELPLVIILVAGVFSASAYLSPHVDTIGIIGGLAILTFSGMQVVAITKLKRGSTHVKPSRHGPFIAGIALSALNPFFITWWLTAGLKLATDSAEFGIAAGAALLFGAHIWMDYVWLMLTAYLAFRGSSVLGSRFYPALLLAVTAVLVYFGVSFIVVSVF
jgi:threonine/homoserine/homoserine lactone efflux protein